MIQKIIKKSNSETKLLVARLVWTCLFFCSQIFPQMRSGHLTWFYSDDDKPGIFRNMIFCCFGFILRFQWWLLSKKVTSLLYWKWHHAHTSIGDGRKCQYRSNGRRHKGFKSKSLSKTSCLLESRMLDEATVPLCLPRKSGKTQAILQSSETAGGDTAAKEKRRSNSLNISTNASFSIWKAQCHRV